MELRFAFTITANPNGFVALALLADGSDPAGVEALVSGTGVHVVFVRDPNEPDPGRPDPGITEPPITIADPTVVKEDEESAPGYYDGR